MTYEDLTRKLLDLGIAPDKILKTPREIADEQAARYGVVIIEGEFTVRAAPPKQVEINHESP